MTAPAPDPLARLGAPLGLPSAAPVEPASSPERESARRLARLLPDVGAAFGASVVLLGVYGYLVHQDQNAATLLLRLALAALAGVALRRPRADGAGLQAAAAIYLVHAAALLINAVSPSHGLQQAAPVLLAWMAGAGLLEPWPARCLRMLAPAALLYMVLAAMLMPAPEAAAVLVVCGAGLLLAVAAGASLRRLALDSWRKEQRLLHACHYDSLSGALSRGYLVERATHDLALARRYRRPLAAAMLDLDYFKRINDSHGHAAGDAVIRALVATCAHNLRATDYIGRLGGEEFVCVMPETQAEEALACAERIRAAFAALQIGAGAQRLHGTVSIGISMFSGQADVDSLLREADHALYQAKSDGRNRVVMAR